MTSSFSTQSDAVPVVASISSVNLEAQTATGYTSNAGNIPIDFSLMPGGIYTVPKIGEQWVCRRTGRNAWQLMTQLPFQDERLNLDPVEGMTVVGRDGPTVVKGDRVDVPSEFYIGGVKYAASSGGGGTTPTPAAALVWDQEMVLNAGALASGYNDLAGGILVNAPGGVLLESIVFRLGGDPAATIGGSGGISVTFYRGTATQAEQTQIGAITGFTAHDIIFTPTPAFTVSHNSVLRAKVTLGSATVGVSCHVQWRGKRL